MTKAVTTPRRRRPPQRVAPRSLAAYLAGPPEVSQRALAEAVGCNQSMISMLVRGKRAPSAGLAVTLHAITGVALSTLLATRIGKLEVPRRRKHPAARAGPAPRHCSP